MKPQGIDDELAVLDGDTKRDALDRKIACRFDPGAVELKRRVDVGQLVHRDRRVRHDAPSLRRMLLRRRGLGIAAVDPPEIRQVDKARREVGSELRDLLTGIDVDATLEIAVPDLERN